MNRIFETPQGVTEVVLSGNITQRDKPLVVMIPGGTRDPADYSAVSARLEKAGWSTAAVYSRGCGKSVGTDEGITLHDLADDVASIIEQLEAGPAIVVGHAFGNRIARCLAADKPKMVQCLILLAAGGKIPPTAQAMEATAKLWNRPSPEERRELMKTAFFAKNSNPDPWLQGSWPKAVGINRTVSMATSVAEWWDGGSAPMLVIQGEEDQMAPLENGELLLRMQKDRVTLTTIPDAAHALPVEQPGKVADLIIDYIGKYEPD